MKRTLALLALVCTAAIAHADLVIEQKMDSTMMNGNVTIQIKGDKMRMDMESGPIGKMSTIMDLATGDSVSLLHAQKVAMKVSGAQAKQLMEMAKKQSGTGGETETPKLQATGKTEKVGTYNTEIYTWSGNGMSQKLWVAKDFPNFAKIKDQMDKMNKSPLFGMAKEMAPDMSKLPGMVVKTEVEVAGQKITTTVVSVKEAPVDASLFETPKDYQQMDQPSFGGQ